MQPHIGGDIALLTGVAKHVLERKGHEPRLHRPPHRRLRRVRAADRRRARGARSRPAPVFRERPSRASPRCTCPRKNAVFGWTMGITHHLHGVENVQMIANLALLRGMIGRPQAGLMPIRGHSNVQGVGSVGVTPRAQAGDARALRSASRAARRRSPGLDTMACVEAADRGELYCRSLPRRQSVRQQSRCEVRRAGARQARLDRLPVDDAQHRTRLGHREGDAGPAGAAARRRVAADDAGVDVQLRAAERRRNGALPGAAQRGVGACRPRAPGAWRAPAR